MESPKWILLVRRLSSFTLRISGKSYVLCLALLLLAGCATPYQSHAFRGGYSDKRIDGNTFEVHFGANQLTAQDTKYAFFLYRCSEVTTNNGDNYFVIQNFKDFELLRKYDLEHEIAGTIKTSKGTAPDEPAAFDAMQILQANVLINRKYEKLK